MAEKDLVEAIEDKRKDCARNAIGRIRKLLDAAETCLSNGSGFPIYLKDVRDQVWLIDWLASESVAMSNLRSEHASRRARRKKKVAA